MAHLLRVPEVSTTADETVLEGWALHEGASFSAGDALATVETDKAVVEIEAEADGTLLKILVVPDATVARGDPIALLGEVGEQVDDLDALLTELGARAALEPGGVVGPDRSEEPVDRRPAPSPAPVPTAGASEPGRIFASPLARRLAAQAGLDPRHLTGTGPGGRVRKRDVEEAVAARSPSPVPSPSPPSTDAALTSAQPRPPAQPLPPSPAEPAAGVMEVEHTRVRRAVASRLTESKRTVPHFYVRGSALVDDLLALRAEVNAVAEVKVSLNDLVLKAAAAAHARHPGMNVTWGETAVRQHSGVDIAVAVASERGLMTPVLRGVDAMTISAVASTVRDLAGRAGAGRLAQGELEGGTLSISNLGMHGVEEFTAIINPPQAAILAVGAVRQEAVVVEGRVAARHVLRFVLSVDHRPVDGAVAAAWVRTFVDVLENPLRILT